MKKEHMAILQDALSKNDISIWNKWRRENSDVKPDLSYANLSDADLRDANLSDADLSYAILRDANLSDAILRDANLSYAILRDANLSDANLRDADLSDADLSDADLSYANLRDAILRDADLSDANLSYANLSDANLRDADLSDADLSDADLSYANLRDAILRDADLSYADLTSPVGLTSFGGKVGIARNEDGITYIAACFRGNAQEAITKTLEVRPSKSNQIFFSWLRFGLPKEDEKLFKDAIVWQSDDNHNWQGVSEDE